MTVGGHNQHDIDLVDELCDLLVLAEPLVRVDVIEAATARLAEGWRPTDLDLAETVAAHFA